MSDHEQNGCAYCAAGEPMEHQPEPPSPVYVKWYGGPNYAQPYPDDLEVFDTVADAHEALISRENLGHWTPQRVEKITGDVSHVLFPCVEDSRMEVYFYDPREDDNGPDLHLHLHRNDEENAA